MPGRLRWLVYVLFLILLVTGCGGGGCSGCAGGAIQPIRGGFPLTPERRIPHAIQVRLTDQGLRNVEGIAPGLFSGFLGSGIPIPSMNTSMSGFNIGICPDRPCTLRVELANQMMHGRRGLELGFAPTDQISAKARIVVYGDVNLRACPGLGCSATCSGTFCVRTTPTINVDTRRGSRAYIGLSTNIAVRRDTHPERLNYYRADLVSPTGNGEAIQETPGETIENDDLRCTDSAICFIVDLLKGLIISQFRGQFSQALGPIQDALAHSAMPNPPGCPTGTTMDGDRCRYADRSLVPLLLGTDGSGNLGSLLASVTPGLQAPNSFVIAAGDPMHNAEAGSNGMSVNVFGSVVSGRHSLCVPRLPRPMRQPIPEYMTLRQNTIPGTMNTMDLGIGVSEDFLNDAFWNLWDSGLFCLGISTRLAQQLSAGFLSGLPVLASLRSVVFPNTMRAPAAIALRPQQPPTVTVGRGTNIDTDPLLKIEFRRVALDFYAWSEERYVRFMTVNTDLTVPLNLMREGTGLKPTLGMVKMTNTTVANSQLLSAQPTALAEMLEAILSTVIGMFAGNIPAVDLPSIPLPGSGGMSAGNINIDIPAEGITGVTEGSSRYLGLFANLRFSPPGMGMMSTARVETRAEGEWMAFDRSVYALDNSFRVERLPRARLRIDAVSDLGRDTEYSYRVDGMTWSPWSTDRAVEVRSPSFISQGEHVIEVRARIAGAPGTEDETPARVVLHIDVDAPELRVEREGNTLIARATDAVTATEQLEYRFAFDDAQPSAWARNQSRVEIPEGALRYTVTVRDPEGNERTVTEPLRPLLIRGGPSTDASGGCGCTATPGSSRNGTPAMLVVAAVLAMYALRRSGRAQAQVRVRVQSGSMLRSAAWWSVLAIVGSGPGCDCGASNMTGDGGMTMEAGLMCSGGMACPSMNRCVPTPTCMCPPGQMASGNPRWDAMTCTYDTSAAATACNCVDLPPLPQGMAGSHLDMAVQSNGTIWFSAYSAGDPPSKPYGDLIVGKWNQAMSRVDWVHVDGVPSSGEVTGQISGWRGGVSTPGPDVGRWNSIAVTSSGAVRVAYWDTTNDKLKFASSADGRMWQTHVVDMTGRNGRFASMVLLSGDIPAIAYRSTATDAMGNVQSRIRYARANSATPSGPTDWTITDVHEAQSVCRAQDCSGTQVCVRANGRCVTPGTCPMMCGSGQACVEGRCQDTYPATWIEDYAPGAQSISMALDPMGRPAIVFYDRDRGNLLGVRQSMPPRFDPAFIIDGEVPMMGDTGDRGLWASLAIDPMGVWHVAYVDGWGEGLLYTRVQNGMRMGNPETIDNGAAVGMMENEDGQHLIGDSASLTVDAMGVVRVAYQDSTAGVLRLATRGTMGWTVATPDSMIHTGYWARLRGSQLGVFWRDLANRDATRRFGVRVFPVR